MKRVLVVAALVGGSLGVFAGSAHAGEITGPSGGDTPTAGPTHANSICVFSGLNDDPTAPLTLDLEIAPNGPGGVSQSYGQDVNLGLRPQEFNPASPGACNPTRPGELPG